MLFDPKWQKADPYTLDGLIAWLEKQPPSGSYNWTCFDGTCLLDQYIKHVTGQPSVPTPLHSDICGNERNYSQIASIRPWTFDAALERAKAIRDGN